MNWLDFFILILASNIRLIGCNVNTTATATVTTSLSITTRKVYDLSEMTLSEFCVLFEIGENSCRCEKVQNVCSLLKDGKQDAETQIVCSKNSFVRTLVSVSLGFFGVFGNIIVIILTKKNWNSSAFCHKLIGALALSDLMFLVFELIHHIPRFWGCLWIYKRIVCKVLFPSINMTATMALGFILIISIERYIGIAYPFSRGMSSTAVYTMSTINVLVSIGTVLPAAVVLDLDPRINQCHELWTKPEHSKIYTWVLFATTFACPVCIISILYVLMLTTLKRTTLKSLQKMNTIDSMQLKRKKENRRIRMIVISLLVAFTLLVSPNRIVWILKDHGILQSWIGTGIESYEYVKWISGLPYILHAVINPIIYSIVDEKFRSSLKNLFRNKQRSKSMYSSKMSHRQSNTTSCGNHSNTSETR